MRWLLSFLVTVPAGPLPRTCRLCIRYSHTGARDGERSQEDVWGFTRFSRLREVFDFVDPGARVCDIGTDHGLLPIALVASGRCPHAIGVDRAVEPLRRAEGNAVRHLGEGWANRLELRRGDGLKCLSKGEADVVCMAGLGSSKVLELLSEVSLPSLGVSTLVLQPYDSRPGYLQSLREWVHAAGMVLQDESIVQVRDRFFLTIKATTCESAGGTLASAPPTLRDLMLGSHIRGRLSSDPSPETLRAYRGYLTLHIQWLSKLDTSIRGASREGVTSDAVIEGAPGQEGPTVGAPERLGGEESLHERLSVLQEELSWVEGLRSPP
jgi:tRNA A22 N-methylase